VHLQQYRLREDMKSLWREGGKEKKEEGRK
jgi:hypothetical protein